MNVGGCYFFRMDNEHIVDATVKGNESRFINHCCDPNCDARVVNINNENKIIFFANKEKKSLMITNSNMKIEN